MILVCAGTRIPRAQTKMKSIKEELQDAQERVKELEVCGGFVVWVCVTCGWIFDVVLNFAEASE